MAEDKEINMCNLLQEVYFGKTRDVVNDLRSLEILKTCRSRGIGVERGHTFVNWTAVAP
jgi:hypothetical protein